MWKSEFVKIESFDLIASKSDETTLFHKLNWLWAIQEAIKGDIRIVMTTDNRDRPVAITPFLSIRKGPFRLYGSPLIGTHTPYCGPIWIEKIDELDQAEILESQCQFLRSKGADHVEFRLPGNLSRVDSQKRKWHYEKKKSLLLDIVDDAEVMWKRMEGRSRNMVRKAEKNDIDIQFLTGTEQELDRFYQMLTGTFAKWGKKPSHPKSFFLSLVKTLVPAKMLLFVEALLNRQTVAMGFFPYDNNEIHYLAGTSLQEGEKLGVNNLIQWKVIQFAVQNGLTKYDLGGTGVPSIDKFKKSFGARETSCDRWVWRSFSAEMAEKVFWKVQSLKQLCKKNQSKNASFIR